MFLPLMLNSCALSPEGFFFPSIGSESLLFFPGLVTIEQGKKHNTLNVFVMNHSETEVQVKKNLEVGTVYQFNDHDVKNTELLQLSKHSLIEPCYPPLDSNPQLRYPIVFNWTLFTSCPPMRSDYRSSLSIGAMRKDALFAAQSLFAKVVFGQAT